MPYTSWTEPHRLPPGTDPQDMRVWATAHAEERLRLHHSGASWRMVVALWCSGVVLESRTAMSLVGRPWCPDDQPPSVYVLTPDRRGILVGVYDPGDEQHTPRIVVVTYLRFQAQQRAFALEHWPVARTEAQAGE